MARTLGTSLEGEENEATGYSIDSRTVQAGDLFFAIQGPRFDGHDFVDSVWEAGAAGVVVERSWVSAHDARGPLLAVDDPAEALRQLIDLGGGRLHIGVLTALIGGPFFLWLLCSGRGWTR